MKRVFSTMILASALALAAGLGGCGGDDNPADGGSGIGSVSGKVTFIGSWPLTGEVQVAIYSSLNPPAYTPTGPPDAFSNPITPGLTEYNYELSGLDPGTYTGILVSWREPSNPSGAKMLGMYWIYGDSLAVYDSGLLAGTAKDPGPKSVTISEANPAHTGLDFTADLNIVVP
jgi:hypothetical protein